MDLSPGDPWCATLAAAAPGDVLRLAPGEYDGPCTLSVGGAPDLPVTLEAADATDRPHIVYDGATSNVLDVLASHVVLRGLSFGPTRADIDAIKIKSGSFITVEDCFFTGVGGISVSANSADGEGLVLRGNELRDVEATGFYLGCHDGASSCTQADVRVEDNLIDGVTSPDVGYGLEIKLDSWGTVRRNVVRGTKGPGIEIYGSSDPSRVTVVEANLVIGSRTSGALEVGGGPVLVRNNLVVAGTGGGIVSYDYGGRGLVSGIHLLGNTAVGDGAFSVSGWTPGQDLEMTSNAADRPMPTAVDGIPMAGNVACADAQACWMDAANLDFWPVAGGPLLDGGGSPQDAHTLDEDFCGQARTAPPDAGALERTGDGGPGPLPVDFASTFACPVDDPPPQDSASGHDTGGDDGKAGSTPGGPCGCAAPVSPAKRRGGLAALALVGVLAALRGRGPTRLRRR